MPDHVRPRVPMPILAALSVVAALAVLAGGPRQAAASDEVVVFAAASLKNALDEVAAAWTAETRNIATLSYAGSSALARQIEQGAPADVFLSANPEWMDVLDAGDLIAEGTRKNLLGNALVLIAHGRDAAPIDIDETFDLGALLGEERLAMALVDAVPAGIYGKAALTSLGAWDDVADNVVQAENVRAALALVARGEAPYGIVYRTDAAADDTVTVVATFPPETHPDIVYPAAVTRQGGAPARAFVEFLASETARQIFERHGFPVAE